MSRKLRCVVETLESRVVLSAAPYISEFVADSNSRGPADGNGDFSDWIEIHNPSLEPILLDQFFLSDDSQNPDKWQFPKGVTLDPDEYLIVFASGMNAIDAGGFFHTNFSLDADGESLLLSKDQQIIDDIFDEFGKNYSGVSIGRIQKSQKAILIGESSPSQISFSDEPDLAWTQPDQVINEEWSIGRHSVGYELAGRNGFPVVRPTDVLKVDFQGSRLVGATQIHASNEPGWQLFLASNSDVPELVDQFSTLEVRVSAIGGNLIGVTNPIGFGESPPEFLLNEMHGGYIATNPDEGGEGIEVSISGLESDARYEIAIWSHGRGFAITDWIDASRAPEQVLFEGYQLRGRNEEISSDEQFKITGSVVSNDVGTIVIQATNREVRGVNNLSPRVNGIQLRRLGVQNEFKQDIETEMFGQRSSMRLRYPFVVEPEMSEQLRMEVAYAAGFVAYLNGTEVARRALDGTTGDIPTDEATAISERSTDRKARAESIDLTQFVDLLRVGQPNSLSFHGFNSDPFDSDFLLSATLEFSDLIEEGIRYFLDPTPGFANPDFGYLGIAPEPHVFGEVGISDRSREVTITTASGLDIAYTTDGTIPSPNHGIQVPGMPEQPTSQTILVNESTVVHAISFSEGLVASPMVTRSFLVVDSILNQDRLSRPESNLPATWTTQLVSSKRTVEADYRLNPEVVARWDEQLNPEINLGIRNALTSLPLVSLSIDPGKLWGETGIYEQSVRSDLATDGTVELIGFNAERPISEEATVQIHGNSGRNLEWEKRQSFRLTFQEGFDRNGQLTNDLFQYETGPINQMVLTTGGVSYLRDTWMSEMFRSAGHLAPPKQFVHLFLNGMYWGVYRLIERVDDEFITKRFGGSDQDIDIIKEREVMRGSAAAWNRLLEIARTENESGHALNTLQGLDSAGTRDQNQEVLLDVDNFIDYIVLHQFAYANDWGSVNWIAYQHRGNSSVGFRFVPWDQEKILTSNFQDILAFTKGNSPRELFKLLERSTEFRIRFADRVYALMWNDGPFSVENSVGLWNQIANQFEPALSAELARWGDVRHDQGEVLDYDNWKADVAATANEILPRNWESTIQLFRDKGLYPAIEPPDATDIEDRLILFSQEGEIYFTTDGSDPRLVGGDVNPNAKIYEAPIDLDSSTTVRARSLIGEKWSTVRTLGFEQEVRKARAGSLRINEINYHPKVDGDAEFIELKNVSDHRIRLTGVRFIAGVRFDFQTSNVSTLSAGEFVVIVKDLKAFAKHYDTSNLNIAGEYDGSLSNSGEAISIVDESGLVIEFLTFNDDRPWPVTADGDGPSLQAITPLANANAPSNWRSSAIPGGTPGTSEFAIGDANLDGVFDSQDLIFIFQTGEYEDLITRNSTWADGDWNGDGEFTSSDFVLAFQSKSFE